MAREKLCLEKGKETDSCLGAKKGVCYLLTLAGDVSGHERLASLRGQFHGAAVPSDEVSRDELLTIDQGQNEAVSKQRPELLDEIESQARTTRSVGVEEADVRVEACGGESRYAVVGRQGIREGQEGVDPIERRTAGAVVHGKLNATRWTDELREDIEVDTGGVTLVASDRVEV